MDWYIGSSTQTTQFLPQIQAAAAQKVEVLPPLVGVQVELFESLPCCKSASQCVYEKHFKFRKLWHDTIFSISASWETLTEKSFYIKPGFISY